MKRLTLSRAPIAAHCVWFLRDGAVWTDAPTTYSKVGHATHACSEAVTNGDVPNLEQIACDADLDDDEAARMRDFVVKLARWAASQDREGWLAEQKLAYSLDDDAGRALPSASHRDYSAAAPGEIVGTADVVFLAEPGRMWKRGDWLPWRQEHATAESPRMAVVLDYKTGWGRGVTPIKRNLQLRGLALAAARAWSVDDALVRIVHIPDVGDVWTETDEITFFGLGTIAAQLGDIVARAVAGTSAPHPGPWCGNCPAKVHCPDTQRALVEVTPPELADKGFRLSLTPSSDDHFRWQQAVIGSVEKAVKLLKEGQKKYAADKGAVKLEDGSVFAGWPSSTRSLEVTDAARALLAGAGVADLVEVSAAIGKIERKLGKAGAAPLFEKLEEIGALTKTPGVKYEARNPKGEAA